MSTVGRATRLRWLAVAAGVAALVASIALAPTALRSIDAAASPYEPMTPERIVEQVLASADVGHQGVAQSRGSLGLPDLPRLSGVPALLGATTRMRVWWATPDAWRVDTLTLNGETGTYGVGSNTVVWDFESAELTTFLGVDGARLPRPDDLLPPQAARRILAGLGSDDRVEPLPDEWVAGRTAAGIRILPGDARSTVAHVDLWVDPASGLPLDLRIVGADGLDALVSTFLDLDVEPPAADVIAAPAAPGAHRDVVSTPDIVAAVDEHSPWLLPDTLASLPVSRSVLQGTATYGSGLVRFALLPLPRDTAGDIVEGAIEGGATFLQLTGGSGAVVTSSVLNAVVIRGNDRDHAYVLAGFVTVDTLSAAAQELLLDPPPRRSR